LNQRPLGYEGVSPVHCRRHPTEGAGVYASPFRPVWPAVGRSTRKVHGKCEHQKPSPLGCLRCGVLHPEICPLQPARGPNLCDGAAPLRKIAPDPSVGSRSIWTASDCTPTIGLTSGPLVPLDMGYTIWHFVVDNGRAQAHTGCPLVGILEREEPDGEVGGTGGASHRAGVEGRPSARPACSELIRLCVKDDRVVMFPALGDAIRLPAGSLSHGIDLKPVQLQAA